MGLMLGVLGAYAYDNATRIDAYEVRVDGVLWFTVPTETEAHQLLNAYKSSFHQDSQTHAQVTQISFVQNVEVTQVRIPKDTPMDPVAAEAMLRRIEVPATVYVVQPGDNLWTVATSSEEIAMSDIIRYNPNMNYELIHPNDEIIIKPDDYYLDVRVSLESTAFEPVEYRTEYIQDDSLYASQRVVVKPGVEGVKRVTYDITMLNGYAEDVVVAQETELIAPVKAVVRVGTKRTLVRTSNSNFGVTVGRLSSNFGNRTHPITGVRTFHAGIDIAAPTGTSVYAYADGTVIAAGWHNSYGKYIMISHGAGLVTVYMHLSSFAVDNGDKIRVGAKIGNVGNTGFSTGPHLHFEVRVNGSAKSPWAYI